MANAWGISWGGSWGVSWGTAATGGAGGLITFLAGGPNKAEVEKVRLVRLLAKKKKQLRNVEAKIEVVEAKAVSPSRPSGILANLHLLEVRQNEVKAEIETILINLQAVVEFLGTLDFDKYSDDDDFEDINWMQ